MLLLLTVIVLSLQSVRHIALFVVVGTPIMAELAQDTFDRYRDRLPRFKLPRTTTIIGTINVFVLVVVAVAVAVYAVPRAAAGFRSSRVTATYPMAALDYVENDLPPGHVFNQYGWGGYFVYRIWPKQQAFIYGDAAVMGDPFLLEYRGISVLQPDFRDVLDRRGVTWVLFPSSDPVEVALRQNSDWVALYQDNTAGILVKRTPQTQDYLVRHGHP
jgi:hypothetical protein